MAELTHGVDDDKFDEIITLASNPSELLSYLELKTYDNFTSANECYASGYIFLRYLASRAVDIDEDMSNLDRIKFIGSSEVLELQDDGLTVVVEDGYHLINNNKHQNTIEYYDGDLYILDIRNTTLKLMKGTVDSYDLQGSDVILHVGEGTIRLSLANEFNGYGSSFTIVDSNGNTLNYASMEITSYVENTVVSGGDFRDALICYADNVTVLAFDGDDYISGGGENILIDAGSGDDILIISGNINSTIIGGNGNDSIYTKRNPVIYYAEGDGNDVLHTSYMEGDDKALIKLTSGKIDGYEIEGTDVILKISDGSIRVKNARGQKITIEDPNGNVTSQIYGAVPDIINDENEQVINGTDSNDYIFSKGQKPTINSGAGDDVIYSDEGGYINAGSGNDWIAIGKSSTISAGSGNDTIENSGRSIIEYTSGDDIILGVGRSDTIKLVDGNLGLHQTLNNNEYIFDVVDKSTAASLGNIKLKIDIKDSSLQFNFMDSTGKMFNPEIWESLHLIGMVSKLKLLIVIRIMCIIAQVTLRYLEAQETTIY